ncbi:MAG: hypothetical protein PVF43_05505 [Candidatus Eiseniibacteriota bacterium]|jgi:hypothetical protein
MRLFGNILVIVGLVIALVFVLADILGLGHDPSAFGQRQAAGTAVGIIVFIVGYILRKRSAGAPPAGT